MPFIELRNLAFSYDGTSDVLSDINLAMSEAHSVLVVGDNGSGKTTLGRLMAGILELTNGVITVAGTEPREMKPAERCRLVSYMSQVSHLSVLTSSIAGEILSFSREPERAAAGDAYVDWAKRHSLPSDISTNPRDLTMPDLWRLVAVLYSAVLQPSLLIVDEVFCAGSKQQLDCARDILNLRKQQKKATLLLYQRSLPLAFDAVFTLAAGRLSPSSP